MPDASPITDPRSRTVAIGADQVVIVRELSLRKLSALAGTIRDIIADPDVRAKLSSGDGNQIADAVLGLVQTGPDRLADAVALSTDLSKDAALDLTPSQLLDVLLVVWEVNDLMGLFKKKVPGLMSGPGTGSTPLST
jgi:hypothetical protein